MHDQIIPTSKPETIAQRNIRLVYYHTVCLTLYQSICCWNVFDAYLSLLATHSGHNDPNTWVGFAESITGVATLVCAIPFGIMADRYNRELIMKIACCIGILASIISAVAFMYNDIRLIYSNLLLWGIFTSLAGTAGEAIFADSCPRGKRSEKTTLKGILQTVGLSLGPLILLVMFYLIGNAWKLSQLHWPLLIGCIFGPVASIPLWFLQDFKKNTRESTQRSTMENPLLVGSANLVSLDARTCTDTPSVASRLAESARKRSVSVHLVSRPRGDSRLSDIFVAEAALLEKLEAANEDEDEETSCSIRKHEADLLEEEERFKNLSFAERTIPYILSAADFITEIGAGMTVRFFPLFFINDYGVSPVLLCLIFGAYPPMVSIAMSICQRLSVMFGRTQISFLCQSLGILLLLSMVYIDNLPILIVVFVLRSQFQNGAYPVDRSIIYDYVPSSQRGRWASVASLTTMTWSGSAVIGGLLADSHDYRYIFLITAIVYSVGLTVYFPLLFLVPRNERAMANE